MGDDGMISDFYYSEAPLFPNGSRGERSHVLTGSPIFFNVLGRGLSKCYTRTENDHETEDLERSVVGWGRKSSFQGTTESTRTKEKVLK